jgi:hypothetical protein
LAAFLAGFLAGFFTTFAFLTTGLGTTL